MKFSTSIANKVAAYPLKFATITRVLTIVVAMMVSVIAWGQPLLTQDFNFSGTLSANGWTAHSVPGTNAVSTTGGLSFTGYAGSGIGNAALVNNLGGEDVNISFTNQNTNGQSIYYSCMVNVTDAAATKTGDYFLHIGTPGGASFSSFAGRVYGRITASGVNFGINNASAAVYGTTNFAKNTIYLLIVKYTINTAGNDNVSLWVVPSGIPATEAAAGVPESSTPSLGQDAINTIALRQGSATTSPQIVVDGIRVATSWADLFPVAPVITSSLTAGATVGTAFNYTITANNNPTSFSSATLPVNGLSLTGAVISGTPTTAGPQNVAITATNGAGSDNQTLAITVAMGSQAITGLPATDTKTFGDAAYALTATGGGSGNAVTYVSSDPLIASISGNTVTILAAGTVTITASQAGNADWNAAADVVQTLTINKANQVIIFNALPDKLDTDPDFALTATGGGSGNPVTYVSSNTAVATISGNILEIVGSGTTLITASQAGNTNYNAAADVSQNQVVTNTTLQNQTITFNALANKTYGDAAFQLTASASSGLTVTYVSSNTAVATVSGDMVTIIAPGSTNITASQPGNGSYNAAPDVVQSLTIDPKTLTITGAVAQDKVYDGTTAATIDVSAATLVGVVGVDVVTVSGGGNFADANVANGINVTAALSLGGADAAKYTLTQPLGLSANITQASQLITGLPATDTRTFNDAPYNLVATGGGSGQPVTYVSSDPLVASVSGNTITIVAPGTTTITASQAGNSNYTAAPDVSQVLTVNKAEQTITFAALPNKLSTDAPYTLDANSSSGLLVSYTSSDPLVATVSGNTVTIVGAGVTTITASQAGNANYNAATPVAQTQTIVLSLPFAPVAMATQPGKSYTENFSDIANWTNAFAAGTGANRWLAGPTGAGTIPGATAISTSTAAFQAAASSSGGVHRGTQQTPSTTSIVLLSTGGTNNTSSSAIDFFMDYTGELAGTLSFTATTLFNSTGDRVGSLKVYASIDGSSWTELTGANLPYVATNNVAGSAAISNIALPASFNNNANARLRFYYHNGTGGSGGSRPKITIDNLTVTALIAPVINSSLTANGTVGTLFSYNITATNNPTSYNATGLPVWLNVNTSTGEISGTPTASGTYNISIEATNAAGTDTKTLVLTVAPGTQTITFNPLAAKTFGDADFALTGTASSGLAVSYSSSDPLVATITGSTVTIVGAGTTTITASQSGDANWNAATPVPQTLTVNKASQSITFGALADKLDTDPPFNLTATATSGLVVSYASSNPAVATVSGNTVTIVGPGTTTITASQAGDANYDPAVNVAQNQVVINTNLLNQTITFNALANKTYGDAPFQLTATGGGSGNPITYVSSNTAVATISGDQVTIIAPGTTNITASQAGDANYNAAPDVTQPLVVDPKILTITGAVAQDKIYNGNAAAVIDLSSALLVGVVGIDVVTVSGGGTFADPNVANAIPVSTSLALGGADAFKYILTQPTGLSADITQAGQSITFGALAPKTAADPAFALTATASSGLTVSYTSSDPLVATVSGNTVTIVGVGSTVITASQAGDVNYSAAVDVTQTLTVTQGSQTITFAALPPKFTTDAPFALTATASSGLSVSYTSSNPAVATVSGNTVTIVGAGSTTITALQAGDANFTAATPVPQVLSVTQPFAPVPMAAQPLRTYTENFSDIANWLNGFTGGIGANRWLPVTAGAGAIPAGGSITASTATFVTGSTGGVQRGSAQSPPTTSIALLSTGATDNSTAAAIDFFMDFTSLVADKLSFDAATVANSTGNRVGTLRVYASTNGTTWTELTGTGLPFIATNNVAASASVSNIALPASFNNSATARLRFYYHNGSGGTTGSRPKISIDNLVVSAVNAPVINSSLTAGGTVDATFSYNITATNTPTSYNATGLPANLTVNTSTGEINGIPATAGTFNISIEASNAGGTDSKTLVLTVAPADQVITGLAATDTRTFGDASYTLNATGGASGNPVTYVSSDPSVATISGNTVTITGGGTTTITASQAGNANYNAAVDVTQLLTVNKANQTISFAPLPNKLDTDPAFALTATASSGLTVTYVSSNLAVATISGNIVTIVGPGTTTITASQAGDLNYNPALDVAQNQVVINTNLQNQTITFNALPNKTYGDAAFQLTATASSGLTVSYVSSNTSVATISGDMVTIVGPGTTNITASQPGDVNYNAAPDVIQPFTVDPKLLTVSGAIAQDKIYDGTTAATIDLTGASLVGVVGTDIVTVSGAGNFADANVANGIAVTTSLTLGGADASKYVITQPTGLSANITQASQSITFAPLAPKTTTDIPFALTATASSGLTISYASSDPSVATVSGNIVTIVGNGTTNITASQPGNINYTAATPVMQPLLVTAAPSVVTWNFGTTVGNAAPSGPVPAGLTVSNVTQGNNNGTTTMLTSTSASNTYAGATGQFNAGAAAPAAVLNTATTTYFEFTLTPDQYKRVTLNSISFGSRSTATGPQAFTLRSSLDGFTANLATGTTLNNSTWALNSPATTGSTSDYATGVTYRIYGHSGTGSPAANAANWRMDDLSLNLTVEQAPACAGTPTAGTAAAAASTFCASGSTTITLTGHTDPDANTGISLQWYSSTDNVNFNPIALANADVLNTGTITQTTYYYNEITCSGSGLSAVSNTVTVTVNQPANAGTVTGTTPLCVGSTATYTSNGDAGGSWSSSAPSIASVDPGTGLVTAIANGTADIIYSVNGCAGIATALQQVTVNALANAGTVTGTSPLCVGATATYTSNGDAGGTWSSSDAGVATVDPGTGLVTAVAAGTANIVYTISSGCNSPVSASQAITVNAIPAAPSIAVVNNHDGTSTLTAGGYTGTLLWSTTETTASITVSAPGTYTVNQTVNGCTSPAGSAVASPDIFADPAVGGFDITDLADVSIPDANAVPYNQVVKLKVPVYNLNQVHVVPAGSITLTIDLGTKFVLDPGFTLATAPLNNYFTWTSAVVSGHVIITGSQYAEIPEDFDGMASFQVIGITSCTSEVTSSIAVDNHASTIILVDEDDDNNASALSYSIIVPAPVISITQPTCTEATGTITITSPTATGMTYSIDGVTYTNTTGVFTPVNPGPYNVTAQTADGCISAITIAIVNPQPSTPTTIVYTVDQPSCTVATGTITITSPTGPGLTYSIDGVDYSNTTGVFTNLVAGPYNLTVKSTDGCVSTVTVATVDPQPATPTAPVFTLTQPTCGDPNGTITISSPTGPGMTYSIDGTTYTNTTGVFSGLSSGPYNVTARSAQSCTSSITVATIDPQPATPTITLGAVNNTGCGGPTGSIAVSASGAPGPFTYTIAGPTVNTTGQTSGTFTSLSAGTYTITVLSPSGCTDAVTATVGGPTGIVPDISLGSDFTNNLFGSIGETQTVVYNVSEIGGNAATGDTIRITKVPGYIISFNGSLTVNPVGATPLDNPRWKMVNSASFVSIIFDPLQNNTAGTLNCGDRVYVAIDIQRNTPNISIFNLSARLRRANGETYLSNNLNSIQFIAE